jgi:hypothetical protein
MFGKNSDCRDRGESHTHTQNINYKVQEEHGSRHNFQKKIIVHVN